MVLFNFAAVWRAGFMGSRWPCLSYWLSNFDRIVYYALSYHLVDIFSYAAWVIYCIWEKVLLPALPLSHLFLRSSFLVLYSTLPAKIIQLRSIKMPQSKPRAIDRLWIWWKLMYETSFFQRRKIHFNVKFEPSFHPCLRCSQ